MPWPAVRITASFWGEMAVMGLCLFVYENADFVRALIEDDSEQSWFWSESWQAAERKVDEEIASGDYQDFETMDEFIADLMSDE
jgi:hypothetical protein